MLSKASGSFWLSGYVAISWRCVAIAARNSRCAYCALPAQYIADGASALGRVLLHDPAILLIDELSLGLAPIVVQRMLERRIDYQPRSGDVPPRFAAMVSDSRSEVWRGCGLAKRIRSTPGTSWTATAGLRLSTSGPVVPNLQLNVRGERPESGAAADAPNSGGSFAYLGPALLSGRRVIRTLKSATW